MEWYDENRPEVPDIAYRTEYYPPRLRWKTGYTQ